VKKIYQSEKEAKEGNAKVLQERQNLWDLAITE
jgi:hypothetical protein